MKNETKQKLLESLNKTAIKCGTIKKPNMAMLFVAIILAFLLAAYFSVQHFGFRINLTNSMKEGIYKVDDSAPIMRGSTVEVCLPLNIAKRAFDRGYIGKGRCDSGYTPLVKKVIAIPQDTVSIYSNGMVVNNKFYSAPQSKVDSKGRVLRAKTIHDKAINGYLVYGSNNLKKSWDSRYFGVLPRANIMGVVRYEAL